MNNKETLLHLAKRLNLLVQKEAKKKKKKRKDMAGSIADGLDGTFGPGGSAPGGGDGGGAGGGP